MEKNSAQVLKKMQSELDAYQNLQKNCVKLMKKNTLMESQVNENKCVLAELMMLKPVNTVFKLTGPVLVKQDLEEARMNVQKRIDYVSKELESSKDQLTAMEIEIAKHRETVQKLQQQYQVAEAMK